MEWDREYMYFQRNKVFGRVWFVECSSYKAHGRTLVTGSPPLLNVIVYTRSNAEILCRDW